MFDRLIVTAPEEANFKNRRNYFLVSSLAVGTVFTVAVVVSIFAAELNLGAKDFELVELITPPQLVAVEPEPVRPEPRPQTANASPVNKVPTRQDNVARLDEVLREVPTTTSTTPNTAKERPRGYYEVIGIDSDPVGGAPIGRDTGTTTSGGGLDPSGAVASTPKEIDPPPPPPVRKPVETKPPPVQSMGVVNGRAASLPKPNYPPAARAVSAQGKVDVQVLIDEDGRVISAKAVSGNPLFRSAAEAAARNARFTQTKLSGVPVKVTGVIVYNFALS